MPGLKTDHSNPTNVNFLGYNTSISFDYGKKSDGRFMPRSAASRALHNNRNRYEFFHSDALKPINRRLSLPILTVYTNN